MGVWEIVNVNENLRFYIAIIIIVLWGNTIKDLIFGKGDKKKEDDK